MPFLSPKMNGFIFGFQRLVWCPKWTPASRRSFITVALTNILSELTLAELEPLAGSGQSVLLAFLRAGVAREEAFLAQLRAQLLVVLHEGARDAEAQGAGLAGHAAAGRRREHVELVDGFGQDQGVADDELQNLRGEVVLDGLAVDDDLSRAGPEEHAGGRRLAPARPVILSRCHKNYATSRLAG